MRKVEVKVVLNSNSSNKVKSHSCQEQLLGAKKQVHKNSLLQNQKPSSISTQAITRQQPCVVTENKNLVAKAALGTSNKIGGSIASLKTDDGLANYLSNNTQFQKHNINITPSKIRVNDVGDKKTSYLTNNTNTFNIFCSAPKEGKEAPSKSSSKKNLQISQIDINVSDKKHDSFTRNSQGPGSNNSSFYKDTKLDMVMEALDFKEYSEIFLKNKIKFEDLFILTKEDLNELKIPLGPRNRILKFVEEYKAFNNQKENFSEKQIQRYFEMKSFTNFLTYSEINTEGSQFNSFGNQRQNSSGNVTQSTNPNLPLNTDSGFHVGSPNFGISNIGSHKIPTPYFNTQNISESVNKNPTAQENRPNSKKSQGNGSNTIRIESGDGKNLQEYMMSQGKELSPQHRDLLFKKLEKNNYKKYKDLQNDRKLKTSQNSFAKKINESKQRSNSSRIDNSSSKSFSFKTKSKKKQTRTIDYDMENESADDSKFLTPRYGATPKNKEKKGSGNILSNNVFSKSNTDLFSKSPSHSNNKANVYNYDIFSKSPSNNTTKEKPQLVNRDSTNTQGNNGSKLSNQIKTNRQCLAKEFINIEEKVGEYMRKLKDLKDKSEDRNNKINSILRKEDKKPKAGSSGIISLGPNSGNVYNKKIVTRTMTEASIKKR